MRQLPAGPICLMLGVLLCAGCAKEVKVAQISGKVTFQGKPVPAGYVSFMPDSSAGNVGAIKLAPIKDGVYNTATSPNPGVSPGATVFRIAGFDGKPLKFFPQGKQIFNPHEIRGSVPDGTTTMDFTVPAAAAENLKIEPTSDIP